MRSANAPREVLDFDVELERRSRKYWIVDGSVILWLDGTKYRVHRSLISRLSPQFFTKCCHISPYDDRYNAQEAFEINSERNLGKEFLETILAHLYHDISLDTEASFEHVLRLYSVTSSKYLDFAKAHAQAGKKLSDLCDSPLEIDFNAWRLLKLALESTADENEIIQALLKKTLYYAYTVVPEISFEEEKEGSGDIKEESEESKTSKPEAPLSVHHLSAPEIEACTRLMTQVSDFFSSTLYQPPPALHMECTDVYASLWMEQAVQPAFADGGMGDPIRTLKRLRAMEWKRGKDETPEGSREQPCEDCLEHRREEWGEEARTIWKRMDEWVA